METALFCLYGPEKATQWLKTRLTNTEEQLKDVTSKGRCQPGPQKSVYYTEVFAIMCRLYRGFSMRVWLSFHSFPRKVSVIPRCPLYRMSAIRRFHCISKIVHLALVKHVSSNTNAQLEKIQKQFIWKNGNSKLKHYCL